MRLDCWQVQNLTPRINCRDLDALRKDVVQLEQRTLESVDLPIDLREGHEGQAVSLQHRLPAVVTTAFAGIRDDGLVFDGDQAVAAVPIGEHLRDDAVNLPGL